MGNNDTFVNMDEVRGWGVRALREVHGKDIQRKQGKHLLRILGGTGLFLIGLYLITDGNEKWGRYEGVKCVCSHEMDDAFLKDAQSQGYTVAREGE